MRDELIERRLADLAARQSGVVAGRQLQALGASRSTVGRWLAAGRLHPVLRGVYAVGHPRLAPGAREVAALLGTPPGAALSRATAGARLGLRPTASELVHVTVPRAGGRRRRGWLVVHSSTLLAPWQIATVDGLRVTGPARTLVDLAGLLPARGLERALDRAVELRLFDLGDLRATIEHCRALPGAARLAAALRGHDPGSTLTRSELEERFLALCRRAGLPPPLVNTRLAGYEVDFLWPQARLVVETDGRATHLTARAFEADRARDVALQLAGYRVLRFSYRQVTEDPARVGRALATALSAAGRAGRRPARRRTRG